MKSESGTSTGVSVISVAYRSTSFSSSEKTGLVSKWSSSRN